MVPRLYLPVSFTSFALKSKGTFVGKTLAPKLFPWGRSCFRIMSKGRKGQRHGGFGRLLSGSLLACFSCFLEVFAVLKEGFLDWLERRKSGHASGNAGAQPEAGRRQHAKAAAASAAAAAKSRAATTTAAALGSTRPKAVPEPPPHASASDSDEEEEQPASAPLLPASWAALAAAPAQEAGWEPVRGKKQQRSVAGGSQSTGPARRGGGGSAAAQAQQRTRGELRVCERPGCGAQDRGFRKCGRWATAVAVRNRGKAQLDGSWRMGACDATRAAAPRRGAAAQPSRPGSLRAPLSLPGMLQVRARGLLHSGLPCQRLGAAPAAMRPLTRIVARWFAGCHHQVRSRLPVQDGSRA